MGRIKLFYATARCPVCNGHAIVAAKKGNDDRFDTIVNDIAKQLYDAKIQEGTIPRALYEHTADRLMDAVFSGMGGNSFRYDDPNNNLTAYLRQNIYSFSAAKSLTEMKVINELLVDSSGKVRSKAAFMSEVSKAGILFNKTYLTTEYNTALQSATMAKKWNEFPDDAMLQYSTVPDNKVRPWHAILDGKTYPKDSPIWTKIYPPMDWNCRCNVIPGVAARSLGKTSFHEINSLAEEARIPKLFQKNTGQTKVIYDEDHTYIQTVGSNKLHELRAEEDYGMMSVKKLYEQNTFPEAKKLDSKDEANNWWKEKAGTLRGSFDLEDKMGNAIRFDNEFRNHVMEDNKDGRYAILSNIESIVSTPDEVWSLRDNGLLTTNYIKYFDDFPYVVKTQDTRAATVHNYESKGKLNKDSIEKNRRGTLLFRKN